MGDTNYPSIENRVHYDPELKQDLISLELTKHDVFNMLIGEGSPFKGDIPKRILEYGMEVYNETFSCMVWSWNFPLINELSIGDLYQLYQCVKLHNIISRDEKFTRIDNALDNDKL